MGAGDTMMRQLLKDHGLEPEKDVQLTYAGGPMHDPAGSYQAFIEGRLGPAKLVLPEEAESLGKQGYPVLLNLQKFYPARHDRITAANAIFVKEDPELLKGFLKGMIRGCRFVLDRKNEERFKEILYTAGFLTSERETRSFETLFVGWQDRVSRDLSVPLEAIQLIVEEQKKAGKISSSFKAEESRSLDTLKQAQIELDREL